MTFITLEGGEGVGKTTQRKLLEERLPQLYPHLSFVFTREPGGTPFAEALRDTIFSDLAKDADGKTMFGLFAAARADHVRRVILPSLTAGKVVICDRFAAATYAYQGCAMENPISDELFLAHYDSLEAHPELTIVLDMDPKEALTRVAARQGQDVTHFDARALDFHIKLREGYRKYADLAPAVFVDASQSVDAVHEAIMSHVRRLIA